jgi:hypothetical protein
LLGSVAAEIIAKIEDFARKKNSIQLRQLWEKFISFLFTSSCFYSVFFVRFFDGLGVEYSTFPKFVYIFYSSYLLKSENLSKRLNNFDFSLDDPLVVIVYAVVVCIIFRR